MVTRSTVINRRRDMMGRSCKLRGTIGYVLVSKHQAQIHMKAFSLILMLGSMLSGLGCERRPEWTPNIISGKHAAELARTSSVVVVGSVVSTALTGPVVPVLNDGGVRLQKIDVAVEAVLKGKTDLSQLS